MSAPPAFRFTGIDLPPLRHTAADVRDALDAARQAGRGPVRPRTPPGPRPVFQSPTGDEFVVLPSTSGPTAVPWVSRSPMGLDDRKPGAGGFVPRDLVRKPAETRLPDGPTRAELIALVLRVLAQLGAAAPRPGQFFPEGAAGGGGPDGPPAASPADPAGAGAAALEDTTPTIPEALKQVLPGLLQEQAVGFLANAWADGGVSFSGLEGVPGNVLGGLGMAAVGAVLGKAFGQPDATSSTAEWAMSALGPKVIGGLLSSGNLYKYLGMGPDKSPPLRVGDIDDLGNPVTEGLDSVLIEDAAASRTGDAVAAPGVELTHGALAVLIGGDGRHAARKEDTIDAVTAFVMRPAPGMAVRTQIGGLTTNPEPPIPDQVKQWGSELAKKNGGQEPEDVGFRTPSGKPEDMPTTPGYWFDPDAGEWRIWDGKGWSATPSEYENAINTPLELLFRPLTGGLGNGTEDLTLGDWIKLGSPAFPRAGTGSTWWVPDTLFGLDIGTLFTIHDWIDNPKDPRNGSFLPGLFNVLGDQWDSFLNLWRTGSPGQKYHPGHWLFQIIYASVVTAAVLLRWFDNWMQNLDEAAGLPDRYGHSPHSRHDRYPKP